MHIAACRCQRVIDFQPFLFDRCAVAISLRPAGLTNLAQEVFRAAPPSEALEARWAEVDFDRRLWTLPPERMKSAKQHVVPLSTAALAVLDRQQSVRARRCSVSRPAGSPLSYASFATAPAKVWNSPRLTPSVRRGIATTAASLRSYPALRFEAAYLSRWSSGRQ
jgi:integrase